MKWGVVIAHGRPSGGVRRMIKFGRSLADRGISVRFLYIGGFPRPREEIELTEIAWADLPAACTDLDGLLCPGDLPLWRLAPAIVRSCRLVAIHLHLGVHSPRDELANIRCPLIVQATTARWIRDEVQASGPSCTVIGPGPLDDDLHEVPAGRDYRIGTLVHAGYGWKNSRAVAEVYEALKEEIGGVELWSYGAEPIRAFPGRFFHRPDLETRRLIYSSCRVWVVPSISEGLGMTGFEAMQCRTPVVSADNAGIREYADEDTCFIFRPSRPQDMRAAIRRLLLDWPLGEELACRAFERIGRFRWSDCIDRLETLLRTTHGARV